MTGLDFLQQYREHVAQIRAIDPKAAIPEPTDIRALNAVRDMLYKLEHPAPQALGPSDLLRKQVNDLQTQLAGDLAYNEKRGIIDRRDFEFPDDDLLLVDRLNRLKGMQMRLERAISDHNLPPEARVKLLVREFQAFKLEVSARLHAIEQELSMNMTKSSGKTSSPLKASGQSKSPSIASDKHTAPAIKVSSQTVYSRPATGDGCKPNFKAK